MKLTKIETVRAFKFIDDYDEYEIIAAHTREEAEEYYNNWLGNTDESLLSYTVVHMTKKRLQKEIGNQMTKTYKKGKIITAYEALIKEYKVRQLPFLFWKSYIDFE